MIWTASFNFFLYTRRRDKKYTKREKMSQVNRSLKNLEAPRPLKSNANHRQSHLPMPAYELQTSMYNFFWTRFLCIWILKWNFYFSRGTNNISGKCCWFCIHWSMQSRQYVNIAIEFTYPWPTIGRVFEINIGPRYCSLFFSFTRNFSYAVGINLVRSSFRILTMFCRLLTFHYTIFIFSICKIS